MIDTALAQTGGAGGPPVLVSFLPLILVFAVFYFLLIRPQQQRAKQHESMLDALKRNDEIVTGGGLYGKVVAINEQIVTVEIAPKVQVRVSRSTIAQVVSNDRDKAKAKDNSK